MYSLSEDVATIWHEVCYNPLNQLWFKSQHLKFFDGTQLEVKFNDTCRLDVQMIHRVLRVVLFWQSYVLILSYILVVIRFIRTFVNAFVR